MQCGPFWKVIFLPHTSIREVILKLDFKPLKQRMSHIRKEEDCLEVRINSVLKKKEANPLH